MTRNRLKLTISINSGLRALQMVSKLNTGKILICFKIVRLTVIRNEPKHTIFTSGGLGLLRAKAFASHQLRRTRTISLVFM